MNEFTDKDQLTGETESQAANSSETTERASASSEQANTHATPETASPQSSGYWSSSDSGASAEAPSPYSSSQNSAYNQGYSNPAPSGYQGGSYSTGADSYGYRNGGQAQPPQQPSYGQQRPSSYTPPPYNNAPYPQQTQQGGYYRQGYQNQTGGPGYPNQGYPQNRMPNQYGANSGWQQPAQPDKYEWKFEDYDKLDEKREKKKRSRGLIVFTVALLCVLSAGLVVLAGYSYIIATGEQPLTDGEIDVASSAAEDSGTAGSAAGGELEISARPEIAESQPVSGKMTIPQVAQAVLPSVVGVIKYDNDQFFEIGGLGSGIIMSEDGYIITNAHVVAEGTGFKVQLHNGDPYDAVVIGYDVMTDLAVIKIDATGLTPAQFGDSGDIQVGETVVAIGNPAGLELAGSVTQGIVSAVNREVRNTNTMSYIQTDAAINPGNSGGALANEYGQVIGINSNKIVAAGYEGIGFAIPISEAKPIIDDLINNGEVTGRVMLGITARVIDEVDARNYGVQMGLSIDTVDAESDLASAGVLKGDILTHIDGERVYTHADVQKLLQGKEPGDTVTLTLYRRLGNREVTYEAKTRLMESR